MGTVLAWLKAFTLQYALKIGKKGYELVEARGKAIAADSEARQTTRKEKLNEVELRMHVLDGKVKAAHGFSVHIVDPNIYAGELKVSRDLVDEVLMDRGKQMRLAQAPSYARLNRKW
jgi:hypothetical protein